MGKPINVYDLGGKGVVVDKSPIHSEDGDLIQAQNAQTDPAGVKGAIRKRDGITKLNSSAMAGTVTGALALPLPDNVNGITRTYYAGADHATNTWKTSSNGTSFSAGASPSVGMWRISTHLLLAADSMNTPIVTLGNKIYYPGGDYTFNNALTTVAKLPTIYSWDGTTNQLIARVPFNPLCDPTNAAQGMAITCMVPYDENHILVGTYDGADTGTDHYGRVLLLDIRTGEFQQVAPGSRLGKTGEFSTNTHDCYVASICVFMGRIWCGVKNLSGGIALTIFYASLEDTTWTQLSLGANAGLGLQGMAVFKGNLYVAGSSATVAVTARLYKITPSYAVTTARATSAVFGNFYTSPIVSLDGSTLFVFEFDSTGTVMQILSTTDGSSFSVAYDVDANVTNDPTTSGAPYLDRSGDIIWPFSSGGGSLGAILKRTSAGVWSILEQAQTDLGRAVGSIRA